MELVDLDEFEEAWTPEPEPFEEFITMEAKRKSLPSGPMILRPSQFVSFGMRMPNSETGIYEPFSFKGRRHMMRPYDTPAKKILLLAARQTEKSTLLGNLALSYSCLIPAHKTLYVSPSAMQTKTFSSDRLKEPMDTSDVLTAFTTGLLAKNIFEKQFVNRSKITLRYSYLSADRTRGIPCFLLEIDELQDILCDNIPVIEQCTSHAPEKYKKYVYAGTPKSLDNTIEQYRSKSSTQGEWVVPCDAHGGEGGRYWNVLGEKNIGKTGLICEKCGKPINAMHEDAQWAHMIKYRPEIGMFEGYRIPQLMVPWKPWDELLYQYENYPRAQFFNEVLGLSFDSGLRPLNLSQVREHCLEDVSMAPEAMAFYKSISFGQPVFMGIDWGCYSEDTRTLTESGWKYYWEIGEGERIAQYDPKTEEITYVVPSRKVVFHHKGEMVHFRSQRQDILVTPDHKMLYRLGSAAGTPWHEGQAQDLVGKDNVRFRRFGTWGGEERAVFVIPKTQRLDTREWVGGQSIQMDLWLSFLGLFLSDGGVCKRQDGKPYMIVLSQRDKHPEIVSHMRSVVEALPFKVGYYFNSKTGDHQWKIFGKELWDWCQKHTGVLPSTKCIPREFLTLSQKQLRILLDALMLGDGGWDKRREVNGWYQTTSKQLAEDVVELAIKAGYHASWRVQRPEVGNKKACYRVSIGAQYEPSLHSRLGAIRRVPYDGIAYCFTVPSGYFITERNGKIAAQGNSAEHSYTVITLATYINMKFRVFFMHRCIGREVEPPVQLETICQLVKDFNVAIIGTDYGGGFDRNDHLMRQFGPQRVHKFQYMARCKKKVEWDGKLLRWKVHRTEVMSDIFNAIKRGVFQFPRWDEFKDPYAQDMCNIFSEYSETLRMIQYMHSPGRPDDALHSLLYCFIGSMIKTPRPDVITPRREEPGKGPLFGNQGWTPLDQGSVY